MFEQALDTYKGLHAVINPAGILRDKMFHKMTDEEWDLVIDVHLKGSYNVTHAAINHFREQEEGSFVLFTSTSGLIGNVGQANYAAAKMGIVGLSRIVAMEGLQKNVRSNVIAPFAWSRMIATIPIKDEAAAKRVERMKNHMRADQVAQLAVSLASSACKDVWARRSACLDGIRFERLPIRRARRVAGQFGKAPPRRLRRAVGQMRGIEKPRFADFKIGLEVDPRVAQAIERYHVRRPKDSLRVERDEGGRGGFHQPDLFLHLPHYGGLGRFAPIHAAARKMPAADVAVSHQQHMPLAIFHNATHAKNCWRYQ